MRGDAPRPAIGVDVSAKKVQGELVVEVTTTEAKGNPTVPVEQLRAMIRLLWPEEITPVAKRQLESLCEQAERR